MEAICTQVNRGKKLTALLLFLSLPLAAEIKKIGDPSKVQNEPAPEANPPAVENGAAAEADGGKRLRALRLRLAEWESVWASRVHRDLGIRCLVVPDAIAFLTVKSYLDLRKKGKDHEAALAEVAETFPRWKRFANRVLFRVELANLKPTVNKTERRLFTLEAEKARESIAIVDHKNRQLKAPLAGIPSGLRFTKLRIKKFWVTSDGLTRQTRPPSSPDRQDLGSIGRKAFLSKPFSAYLLEEKPGTLDLLVSRKTVAKSGGRFFNITVNHWKVYQGPFEKDQLDLNQSRPWDEISGQTLKIELPPAGLEVSSEILALVAEVEKLSAQ